MFKVLSMPSFPYSRVDTTIDFVETLVDVVQADRPLIIEVGNNLTFNPS